MSPCANHSHALTSCKTLRNCFKAITGRLILARTQGRNESILLALANSNALALYGLMNREDNEGFDGLPGCKVLPTTPLLVTCSRDGDKLGEEKERR